MKRTLRVMFLTVEINLLLWLVVAGAALARGHVSGESWLDIAVPVNRLLIFIGLGFSMIIQHWAYYAVYRKARELEG